MLDALFEDIRAYKHCAKDLPFALRPVLQALETASPRIIGRARGRKVHEGGVPWSDKSGERLRGWLGMSQEVFYDPRKVALIGMGLCYPRKA